MNMKTMLWNLFYYFVFKDLDGNLQNLSLICKNIMGFV